MNSQYLRLRLSVPRRSEADALPQPTSEPVLVNGTCGHGEHCLLGVVDADDLLSEAQVASAARSSGSRTVVCFAMESRYRDITKWTGRSVQIQDVAFGGWARSRGAVRLLERGDYFWSETTRRCDVHSLP